MNSKPLCLHRPMNTHPLIWLLLHRAAPESEKCSKENTNVTISINPMKTFVFRQYWLNSDKIGFSLLSINLDTWYVLHMMKLVALNLSLNKMIVIQYSLRMIDARFSACYAIHRLYSKFALILRHNFRCLNLISPLGIRTSHVLHECESQEFPIFQFTYNIHIFIIIKWVRKLVREQSWVWKETHKKRSIVS